MSQIIKESESPKGKIGDSVNYDIFISESTVNPAKYIVLDVETNGLSAVKHDLLSISIYRPDTNQSYDRFLPLELNDSVLTTSINGIKESDIKGLQPLSQHEVDNLIADFDIKNRTVLTYGSIDEKFLIKYFNRHQLQGIEYFSFYNFKHDIISSRFSEGNITKDNLCDLLKIKNVKKIHSGNNDCILEWKLFERINGKQLLITENKVFEFSDDYIVPVSFLYSHTNFKYYLNGLPSIKCNFTPVYSITIPSSKLKKFPTNFNGMILEHIINSVLKAEKTDSRDVLLQNKSKLVYLGELPSKTEVVPMEFKPDGTMKETREKDKKLAEQINEVIAEIKKTLLPLFDFISSSVFANEKVISQELVINSEKKILALCDLSSQSTVLEIKASSFVNLNDYANQLYYESNGRRCYILHTDWRNFSKGLTYIISEVKFSVEYPEDVIKRQFDECVSKIETDNIKVVSFIDKKSPVKLKCLTCNNEWTTSSYMAFHHRPCPECERADKKAIDEMKKKRLDVINAARKAEEKKELLEKRKKAFQERIAEKSNNSITLLEYKGSDYIAKAKCNICDFEWETRADHLISRPYCRKCGYGKVIKRNTSSDSDS